MNTYAELSTWIHELRVVRFFGYYVLIITY